MLSSVEDTPDLGRHPYLSAGLFGVVRDNLAILDQVTRVGPVAFTGGYGHPPEYTGANPLLIGRAGFRVMPGATTLTTVVFVSPLPSAAASPSAGDRLRLRINGSEAATWPLSNGQATYAATIPAVGPTWGVGLAQWEIYNEGGPTNGTKMWPRVELVHASLGPVPAAGAWPGAPSFAGQATAGQLAQLADAVDWIIATAGRRTEPHFHGVFRAPATSYTGQPAVRWWGGVDAPGVATTLRATGVVWAGLGGGASERIRLVVDGAQAATYAVPLTPGVHAWELSATVAAGVRRVAVEYERLAGPPGGDSGPGNRWAIYRVGCEHSGAAPITLPPEVAARTPGAWPAARGALGAAATAATNLKARMDAAPALWQRQTLFRRRVAADAYQDEHLEPAMAAFSLRRTGEAILVRGAGCEVQWGPGRWLGTFTDFGLERWELARRQGVAAGESQRTELLYLSALDGLPGGALHAVRGANLEYAAEIWRVGADL